LVCVVSVAVGVLRSDRFVSWWVRVSGGRVWAFGGRGVFVNWIVDASI
jgi:hypothetical protein